jgi:hypothetical protein
MHPFLASDFGNLGAFLIGVPSLLLATIIGFVFVYLRRRLLAAFCGLVCIGSGFLFLCSLTVAREGDLWLTIITAVIAVGVGVILLVAKRQNPQSEPGNEIQEL